MPKIRITHRIALAFLSLSLLIFGGLFLYATNPPATIIRDEVADATIYFEIKESYIRTKADCYNVVWDVQGIQAIYLNDSGKTGTEEETLCYADVTRPELRVVFEDNTEKTYSVRVEVLQSKPLFWGMIGLGFVLLFISGYFFVLPFYAKDIDSRNRLVRVFVRMALIFAVTIVVLGLLLEVGLRAYFGVKGSEDDLIRYIYTAEEIQEETALLVGVPYVLYLANPDYEGHNEYGYRGEEFTIDKAEGTYRIVTIGASTTYGFGVLPHQAYPPVLEDILNEDFGYTNVEVINAGIIGYTSYEVLTNFEFRVLDLQPDLIIYYGAKNDADTRFENPGCYNRVSPLRGLTTFQGLWETDFDPLPTSALYRFFAINVGLMEVPGSIDFALTEIPIADECESGGTYSTAEILELNEPVFAERNIRNLIGLAQLYDIDVMMSRFVYPTTLEQVGDDRKLIMPALEMRAVGEMNDLYRTIAGEMGIYYYDMESDFVIEPGMFWTNVHMTAQGTKQQAELYANYLVENNIIPTPEDS